ncbi:MAG TPA: hypothetical protein VLT59_01450 [Steroidobacteraceae bacterium]|nr:hypothetical protein [Steroidobacteraceae bacterium]
MSNGQPPSSRKPGRNERGKALYGTEPRHIRPGADEADPDMIESFSPSGLSTVDDDGPASAIRGNERGLTRGYNPYNSGNLYKKSHKKKRDMRELSKWIELKKKLANKQDE